MKLNNSEEFFLKTFKSGILLKVFPDFEGTVRFLPGFNFTFKFISLKGNQKIIFLKKYNNNQSEYGWNWVFVAGKILLIDSRWLKEAVRLNDV